MGVARKSYLLGSSYADVGLEEKGDSLLQVAATMEPNNADFHERLAEVRTALGRTESALSEYATACQLNPRSRGALLKMGDLLKQKGESTRARECYRKYLKVDSLSYDARQIQKYLGETAH